MSTTVLERGDLRGIDLFDDIDDRQLEEWLPIIGVRTVPPGEVLIEQGEIPAGVILLLEGTVEALMIEGERADPINRQEAPTWMAAIAVLTDGPLGVRMQTLTECRVGDIPAEDFRRLAFAQPAVHRTVIAASRPRHEPRDLRSSRAASGSPRSARWPPAWHTS